MYLTISEAIFLIICAGIMGFMLVMLFIANHSLLTKNRYLKEHIKKINKDCTLNHVKVPF